MNTAIDGARPRAAHRPSGALSAVRHRLAGAAPRRVLAAAAAAGLVLTVAPPAAGATNGPTSARPQVIDVSAATAEALTALVTTPTVLVPAGVSWSVEPLVAQATPPPPPEPEPAPPAAAVARDVPAASRSGERAALTTHSGAATTAGAGAEPAPPAAPAPPPASSSGIVSIARQFIGTPYVTGGSGPGGFDCSGFTQYVFAQAGINLPRSSGAQRNAGTVVSAAEARPGDLVWGPGHVGIYTGDGNHIAARSPGKALQESPIYLASPVFIRVS